MNQVAPIYQRVSNKYRALPKVIKALVIDDDQFDRTRLRHMFSEIGLTYEFTETANLEEMRKELDQHKFDIVFIDYYLTDGNGLEVLKEIQNHQTNRDAATIMIAGEGQAEIAVRALKNGCSDYIIKDKLSSESLGRAVINALQKSALQFGLDSEANMRTAFEKILNGLKSECIVEMRPMLSKMLVTVRKSKTQGSRNPAAVTASIMIDLETSCLRLFTFLDDIENFNLKTLD